MNIVSMNNLLTQAGVTACGGRIASLILDLTRFLELGDLLFVRVCVPKFHVADSYRSHIGEFAGHLLHSLFRNEGMT
jgi:hypothetical protein